MSRWRSIIQPWRINHYLFRNVLAVYYTAATILDTSCIYTAFLLPESIAEDSRLEIHRKRRSPAKSESHVRQSFNLRGLLVSLSVPFESLRCLKPTRNTVTGKRNWRLVYCATHVFLISIADGYAVWSMIVFLTTRYNYTPIEVRFFPVRIIVISEMNCTFRLTTCSQHST